MWQPPTNNSMNSQVAGRHHSKHRTRIGFGKDSPGCIMGRLVWLLHIPVCRRQTVQDKSLTVATFQAVEQTIQFCRYFYFTMLSYFIMLFAFLLTLFSPHLAPKSASVPCMRCRKECTIVVAQSRRSHFQQTEAWGPPLTALRTRIARQHRQHSH